MKHSISILLLSAMLIAGCLPGTAQSVLPYKNPSLSASVRTSDLLSRMTIEEKVGQLRCTLGWNYYEIRGDEVLPSESFKKDIAEGHIGMAWATFRADPWTQKSLANGLTPRLAAKAANALQRYAVEHTRLGIPLFLAEEAPHGHMAIGTTVFPTGLALAATWSPDVAEAMGRVVGKEVRLQGAHISYGPVLDLSRDGRWSRVEESMGEDPVLTADMGIAIVRGLGGGDLQQPYATLPTLKHFIAYGSTEGGQNGAPSVVGSRDLLQNFLPPFRKAIGAGALSVMTSYNSLDGIPSTANDQLLTHLLRDEWKFDGFVVSDLYSIDGLAGTHHVAANLTEAAAVAMRAGVDVDLGAQAYARLIEAVRHGKLDESLIDEACRRVLLRKFEMGLFEHPYVSPDSTSAVGSADHAAVALDAARRAITLLKNENATLPLSRTTKVALVGPNAHNVYNMLGDYTAPQPEHRVKTILDGLLTKLPHQQVEYVKGCAVRDTAGADIPAAVAAALRADVVIAAVGGSSARDFRTSYQATGAAETGAHAVSDMDCGEGFDRASLSLLGRQQELLEALRRTGKPLVVVYVEGRPMNKTWAAAHADALLTAYYPGQEGGQAIADVLFGDVNPAGRLPMSVPVDVGQLPVYYNRPSPLPHNYVEMPARPLYAFGHGLSYTTFAYSDLRIEKAGAREFRVTCNVSNTGSRDGDEVVQLYLHDRVSSVVQPVMQLKRFRRVTIAKGATVSVSFALNAGDLSLINRQLQRVVEPGDFDVMVGAASDDIRLRGSLSVE